MGIWKALKSTGTGWIEIDRAAGTGWKELTWDSVAIDVGAPCIDGDTSGNGQYTIIGLENPANANGTLTKVCIWCVTQMVGIKIGTFYNTGGDNYYCRDADTIGTLNAGKNENIVISLSVETGDFLGLYWSSGSLEKDSTGSGGLYKLGDHAIKDSEETYTPLSGSPSYSFYAEG